MYKSQCFLGRIVAVLVKPDPQTFHETVFQAIQTSNILTVTNHWGKELGNELMRSHTYQNDSSFYNIFWSMFLVYCKDILCILISL